MGFQTKLLDYHRGLYLYGVTPPRMDSSEGKIYEIAEKLAARLSKLDLDAINIYDIQEEEDRNQIPRPFPFLPTIDPRRYANILKKLIGKEVINYKCVAHHPKASFEPWLSESWEQFDIRHLSLVGGSTSKSVYPGPSLSQAAKTIASHRYDFIFGGVTIAERHASKGNEHLRLIEKTRWGMKFFTSQVVYQTDSTIQLLQDYYQAHQAQQVSPARIILTFAPCGTLKTLEFLRWLGVNIPTETEQVIFSADSPVDKSIEVCCSNLRRILDAIGHQKAALGINVESVSIKKAEIDASVDLFYELKAILSSFYQNRNKLSTLAPPP